MTKLSDTPETDNLAQGNHVVPTEWAEQLERERDEAREHLAKLIDIAERAIDDLACEEWVNSVVNENARRFRAELNQIKKGAK
jgi:hypothetical protein